MVTQATLRAKIKEHSLEQTAIYFGLIVEVIDLMPILTLVRYRSRKFGSVRKIWEPAQR